MVITSENNIIYGGPVENSVIKGVSSLGELILDRFNKVEEKVVLVDAINGIEVTAGELKSRDGPILRNLDALGVKDGDTVAVCCENRLEFAYCMFGTMMINGTFAPINASYTENELNHLLGLAKPKVVFVSGSTLEKIYTLAERYSFVQYVISFDGALSGGKLLPFNKFCKMYKGHPVDPYRVPPANIHENIAALMCSSGTTGMPKGVQLTQSNLLNSADGGALEILFSDAVVLNIIPWTHAYGFITLMMITAMGSKVVFLPKFQLNLYLNCIQHYRVSIALMVPSLMALLVKSPLVDKYDLSSLQLITSSSAQLTKELIDAVQKRTGVPNILQGYGLTETTTGVLSQNADHWQPGSVGTVRVGIYAKVIDVETGKPLGPNQNGELCFKGNTMMKGYIGDSKSTSATIDREGWLHTGDIGYYDENFNFYLVDRIKELIKYKGFQVAPAEIEVLLLSNPKIRDAAVIGIPDEISGELPMALVVKEDPTLTQKDVFDFVAEKLSRTKWLHGGVKFVDDIPRNTTGKIMRRLLRDKINNEMKSKL